jgi:hypothetical protein
MRLKKVRVQKSGWNTVAMLAGPFWYLYKGMAGKGFLMLALCLATLGLGVLPVWIYCGFCGNPDYYRYLKQKNIYIYE